MIQEITQLVGKSLPYQHNGNTSILFVNPELKGGHLYRFMLPAIILREVGYDTCITNISNFNPRRTFDELDIPLTTLDILNSDYIFFPFTTQPLKEVYAGIRRINKRVEIVFDVPFNFFCTPVTHPYHKILSDKNVQQAILENVAYADIPVCANKNMMDYLFAQLDEKPVPGARAADIAALLYLTDASLSTVAVNTTPNTKFRLGIIASMFNYDDINPYKGELAELNKECGDALEIVSFGYNGAHPDISKNCLDGVRHTYEKPVKLLDYFTKLSALNFDLVFLPLANTDFAKTSENMNRFYECAINKIPVIAPAIFPYTSFLNAEHAFLFQKKAEFIGIVKELVANRSRLKAIGAAAQRAVYDAFTFTPTSINYYTGIIPKRNATATQQ